MSASRRVGIVSAVVLITVILVVHMNGQTGRTSRPNERLGALAKYAAVKQVTELEWKVLEFNSQWYFHNKAMDYVTCSPLVVTTTGTPLQAYAAVREEALAGSQRFSSLDRATQQGKITAACLHYLTWVGAAFPEIHKQQDLITIQVIRDVDSVPVEIGHFMNGRFSWSDESKSSEPTSSTSK